MKLKTNNFTREINSTFEQSENNKQLVFSICSEEPYLRYDEFMGNYWQVLEVSPEAINDQRLKNGISFLKDHEQKSQLGIVKRWWIDNKKLYVSVKFSRSNFAKSIKADIEEGIRPWCSLGYIVEKFEKTGTKDGIPVLTAKRYSIYECSSVSTPADSTVGFNRELEIKQKEVEMNEQINKTDSNGELEQKKLEQQEANVELENQTRAVETGKETEETAVETEENVEQEQKEKAVTEDTDTCPICGKNPCQCEDKECGINKPEEKQLELKDIVVEEALNLDTKDLKINLPENIAEQNQIRSLGQIFNDHDGAEKYIAENRSLDEYKTYLKTKNADNSKNSIQDENKMDKKYFSIVHAIRNAGNLNKGDLSQDYETQVVFENKRNLGIDDADIVLTNAELYQRALGPTSGKGAELINTDYLPNEFVPFDRPQLTIDKVGYYPLPSNGQPISFTQCVSGATAAMYSLDGELSAGDMDFVLKTMTPHKAGVNIPIPYSLLLEGRPDADALVQNDVVNALYQKRDEQVWAGTGANNQIAGIQSLTGINIITGVSLSAGDAWGGMLSGVGAIRKANIFNENISYVMNNDTYITLKKTMKDKNNAYGGWIIEDDKIGIYPVYVNNAVSANTVLVGVGSDIAVTDFRGLGILVDPYTYSNKQSLKITAWMSFDMVLRRLKSWTKITLTA